METTKMLAGRGAAVGAALGTFITMGLFLAGSASATTDPIMTEFDNLEAKVTTYAGAIVALVVLSAAIFLGIKYLRKGVSKA